MRIIPARDPLKDSQLRLHLRVEATPIKQFTLQRGEKRLRHRVIVGGAHGTDRGYGTHFAAALAEGEARVLAAVVGMMETPCGRRCASAMSMAASTSSVRR